MSRGHDRNCGRDSKMAAIVNGVKFNTLCAQSTSSKIIEKNQFFLAVFEKKKKQGNTNKQINRTTRILKPREMMLSEGVVKEKFANTNIDCILFRLSYQFVNLSSLFLLKFLFLGIRKIVSSSPYLVCSRSISI